MSFLNKCLVLGTIMLLAGGSFMLHGQSQCVVTNLDTSETFDFIQEAINDEHTLAGHTLEVSACTCYENIIIHKSVTLQGYHMFSTYIQGDCTTHVVKITAPGVTIKNLCISGCGNSGPIYCGININSEKNIIENTLIAECYRSIQINGNDNIIRNNMISTTWDYYEGIAILSNKNKIYSNNIFRARTFPVIGLAIQIVGTQENKIYGNTIQNHEYGIYSYAGQNNDISSNTITNNYYGIYMDWSNYNSIIANKISDSQEGIYLYCASNSNVFHRNSFFHNGGNHAFIDNTLMPCTGNMWYDINTSVGNYWEYVHNCVDNNGDDICDNPYTIPPGNGAGDQDLYPLEFPWVTVCGNVDGDLSGNINQSDIDYLLCYIFWNCPNPLPPIPLCAGDANGDGEIDIADVTVLVNYVHQGGPAPSACLCN